MQRAWLQASLENLAVQPVSALVYLFERWRRDQYLAFPAWLTRQLESLWPVYRRIFGVIDSEVGVLLLRLGYARPASIHSKRHPLSRVLRFF
jgi:hypothetical protein